MFYPFVVFFLVLPIIEIWALIKLGNYFGFFGTLIIIIGTAIIGIFIAKQQGLGIIFSLQSKLAQGKQALPEITDIFGIILIIPSFRKFLLKLAVNKIIHELRKRENRY